jgi:hypothetical protein
MNLVSKAIQIVGLQPLAAALGVKYQSIYGWQRNERLPRSEFTGETRYAATIARETKGEITEGELLDWSRRNWSAVA